MTDPDPLRVMMGKFASGVGFLVFGIPLIYIGMIFLAATVTFAPAKSVAIKAAFEIDGQPVTLQRVVTCKPARSKRGDFPLDLDYVTVMRLDRPDIGWKFANGSGLIIRLWGGCGRVDEGTWHEDKLFRLLWLDDADQPRRIEIFDPRENPGSNARVQLLGLDLQVISPRRVSSEPDMAFIPEPRFPGRDRDYVSFSGILGIAVDSGPMLENAAVRKVMASATVPTIVDTTLSVEELSGLRVGNMQSYGDWPSAGAELFPLRIENGALRPSLAERGTGVLYRMRDLYHTPCAAKPYHGVENRETEPVVPNPHALTSLALTDAQREALDCAHRSYDFVTLEVSGARFSVAGFGETLIYDPGRKVLFYFTPGSAYTGETLSVEKAVGDGG